MGNTFLETIVNHKKQEVALAKQQLPEKTLLKSIQPNRSTRSLIKALSNSGTINIIAEIKRASPSKGTLCESLNAAKTAQAYQQAGAAAISVLTDRNFFKGSLEDFKDAKSVTNIPVLRKDFIVSAYQVIESAAMGADAVLLIVRILSLNQLQTYLSICNQLGLEVLVEVHSAVDMKKALDSNTKLIGINNRDLATFETDITRATRLRDMLGPQQIPVAASGIHSKADILNYCRAGMHNFLIGESLVRSEDPGARLQSFRQIEKCEI